MKCLVVDDSLVSRRILVQALKLAGFADVIEAANGVEAEERCTPEVGLILTDWNMPQLSGIELIEHLREKPSLAAIPIVIVTSRNAKSDIVEAARAGANGYVLKPFTPDSLRTCIDDVLKQSDPATGTDG